MPDKLKKQGRQMATGKSEGRVVPLKPGNSGGGKAAEPSRDLNWASSGHRAGTAVLTQALRSVSFDVGDGGEPDALTAHVRFWEGANPN